MSGRAASWRNKPSQDFQQSQLQLNQQSSNSSSCLYLLQRLGPASFIIGQSAEHEVADIKYKVTLGNVPCCSCWSHGAAGGREPCIHLLFVMMRIFRLAANNPLLWQSALTDRELQQVLDGSLSCFNIVDNSSSRLVHAAGGASSNYSSSGEADCVQRRPVEEDEPCPICYEPLSAVSADWLVWCSSRCGRSIHGKCMRVWSDHQTKTLQQEITCPLCRCSWGSFDWRPPPNPITTSSSTRSAPSKPHHKGVECGACHQNPIEGARYRCLSCASYNLCSTCFNSGQHLQHSFVWRQTAAAEEHIAERPLQGAGVFQCGGLLHHRNSISDIRPAAPGGSPAAAVHSSTAAAAGNSVTAAVRTSSNSSNSSSSGGRILAVAVNCLSVGVHPVEQHGSSSFRASSRRASNHSSCGSKNGLHSDTASFNAPLQQQQQQQVKLTARALQQLQQQDLVILPSSAAGMQRQQQQQQQGLGPGRSGSGLRQHSRTKGVHHESSAAAAAGAAAIAREQCLAVNGTGSAGGAAAAASEPSIPSVAAMCDAAVITSGHSVRRQNSRYGSNQTTVPNRSSSAPVQQQQQPQSVQTQQNTVCGLHLRGRSTTAAAAEDDGLLEDFGHLNAAAPGSGNARVRHKTISRSSSAGFGASSIAAAADRSSDGTNGRIVIRVNSVGARYKGRVVREQLSTKDTPGSCSRTHPPGLVVEPHQPDISMTGVACQRQSHL